jgi:hypothetical protein
VTKFAIDAIEALKGNPGLLVLVLLQVVTLAAIYFFAQANQARSHSREMAMIERCFTPDRN